MKRGISSTTRYRKDSKRKTQRNPNPAPLRVQSGAKGGQATRRSARRQQMAASPHNSLSPSSGISRPHSLRNSHHARRTQNGQLSISSSQQQRSLLASSSSSLIGKAVDAFDPLPPCHPSDVKIEDSNNYLVPFATNRSLLDWSLSSSPLSHPGNEISWLSNPQNLGA